jgi:hypothetical protein
MKESIQKQLVQGLAAVAAVTLSVIPATAAPNLPAKLDSNTPNPCNIVAVLPGKEKIFPIARDPKDPTGNLAHVKASVADLAGTVAGPNTTIRESYSSSSTVWTSDPLLFMGRNRLALMPSQLSEEPLRIIVISDPGHRDQSAIKQLEQAGNLVIVAGDSNQALPNRDSLGNVFTVTTSGQEPNNALEKFGEIKFGKIRFEMTNVYEGNNEPKVSYYSAYLKGSNQGLPVNFTKTIPYTPGARSITYTGDEATVRRMNRDGRLPPVFNPHLAAYNLAQEASQYCQTLPVTDPAADRLEATRNWLQAVMGGMGSR